MKDGPDIAQIGGLIGDPARANMLTALMSGKALTAAELAHEAGVTPQTASTHLARLVEGGMICQRKQGRHRYYTLSDADVGKVLEGLMGLAARRGHLRTRTGPRDPALRKARICYDHLAGDFGVRMFDSLMNRGLLIQETRERIVPSAAGEAFFREIGIEPDRPRKSRRPLCRACLDWSARKNHLAGSLGAELLVRFFDLGWAKRVADSRVIAFSPEGERQFNLTFPTS
jgi:DNA-binding transcriptional ArsR family regulator